MIKNTNHLSIHLLLTLIFLTIHTNSFSTVKIKMPSDNSASAASATSSSATSSSISAYSVSAYKNRKDHAAKTLSQPSQTPDISQLSAYFLSHYFYFPVIDKGIRNKVIMCPQSGCFLFFSNQFYLTRHIEDIHVTKNAYECKVCNKHFENVSRHDELIHSQSHQEWSRLDFFMKDSYYTPTTFDPRNPLAYEFPKTFSYED